MEDTSGFENIFNNSENAKAMGIRLRKIVYQHFKGIDENIVGGKKVKLALYSRGGYNNVLCGIQQSKDACLLYVHHLDSINHERLKFSGKGKHAKRINFDNQNEIRDEDILWLFDKVSQMAPF